MPAEPIRFEDGAAYEQAMGLWSQAVGRDFLTWLALPTGLRWVDIGCGNGAFTGLVLEHAGSSKIEGIDPSPGQIAYASSRASARGARFQIGDALSLPFEDSTFDVAIMALVIFFVPAPTHGVDEMVRVVRPGGWVATYAWDILGGGFPFSPIHAEMAARGMMPVAPPFAEVSQAEALQRRWCEAGLEHIEARPFTVQREFVSFEHFWTASTALSTMKSVFEQMPSPELADFKAGVRARLPAAATDGSIVHTARANAIRGRRHAG